MLNESLDLYVNLQQEHTYVLGDIEGWVGLS